MLDFHVLIVHEFCIQVYSYIFDWCANFKQWLIQNVMSRGWMSGVFKQLFLRVQARAKLEQPMKRLYRIITRSRAAPAWYDHTAVQCACAVDTVTVDKADHSQAWPWPELGGSAPVPLGQRLCLNSVERGESTRALLSGGLWEDSSRINKGSDCKLDENRTTPFFEQKDVLKNPRCCCTVTSHLQVLLTTRPIT